MQTQAVVNVHTVYMFSHKLLCMPTHYAYFHTSCYVCLHTPHTCVGIKRPGGSTESDKENNPKSESCNWIKMFAVKLVSYAECQGGLSVECDPHGCRLCLKFPSLKLLL